MFCFIEKKEMMFLKNRYEAQDEIIRQQIIANASNQTHSKQKSRETGTQTENIEKSRETGTQTETIEKSCEISAESRSTQTGMQELRVSSSLNENSTYSEGI